MTDRGPLVLGLVGGAGANKAGVAEAMARGGFCPVAFAQALRIEISQSWRVDARLLTDRTQREEPLPSLAVGTCTDPAFVQWSIQQQIDLWQPRSLRWVMQYWGTDYRRAQNPSYWTRVVEALIHRRLAAGQRCIVISDVRMHDEAELVRQFDGVLLRVRCDESPLLDDTSRHASEAQWRQIHVDGDIRIDGTLARFDHDTQCRLQQLHDAARALEVAS